MSVDDACQSVLAMSAGCNPFDWGTFLRRIDHFIMDLVRAPREVERFLDALMVRHLA